MERLEVSYRLIADLRPRIGNPRTHSKKQIDQIAASMRRFGFTNPILVDNESGIIAGHGRVEAAKVLGMTEVPTLRLSDMSEVHIRSYLIADNKLAENAGWDKQLLGIEFSYLNELDFDFDMTVTGFEHAEIDALIALSHDDAVLEDPEDEQPEIATGPTVTIAGDIWQIGRHRLICGDALVPTTYAALLGEAKAAMVFTDPPYNVRIEGHVSGLGKVRHREFAMASGEMTQQEFTRFLFAVFGNLTRFSVDGSIHFHCIDWRHLQEMLGAGNASYAQLKNVCVWAKTNGGMGSLYRSAHEMIFVFKSGNSPHVNNIELGKNGRYRTNVWTYPGANSFGGNRTEDLALHPTVKPVALVSDAILDCSRRKDIVLDAFAGSGTTLIAAQKTGRLGYGIEIDPIYCDTIIRRMRRVCKLDAVLMGSSKTFDEVSAERLPALRLEDVQ